MVEEPNFLDVALDWAMNGFLQKSIHREYVKTLGLTGNEVILDVGSGSGAFTQHVAEAILMGEGRITCVEPSETWIEVAKKRLAKRNFVDFVQSEMETAGLADRCFTTAIIHCTLCGLDPSHRQSLINATVRRIRRGGTFFIKEPTTADKGIQAAEIRRLMEHAGWKEVEFDNTYSAFQGPAYQGTFKALSGRAGRPSS